MSPELVSGVVFGVVMFFLGVIALWQNRRRRHRQGSSPSTQLQSDLTPTEHQSHDGIYQPQSNGVSAHSQHDNARTPSQDDDPLLQNQSPHSAHQYKDINASVRRQDPNAAPYSRSTDVSVEVPSLSVVYLSQYNIVSVPQQGLNPVSQYRDTGTSDRVVAHFVNTQDTEDTDAPDQFQPVRTLDIV